MFPLKNTEAYIHANGFRSTLGKELADRDAEISELGSEIQALTNYDANTGVKNLHDVSGSEISGVYGATVTRLSKGYKLESTMTGSWLHAYFSQELEKNTDYVLTTDITFSSGLGAIYIYGKVTGGSNVEIKHIDNINASGNKTIEFNSGNYDEYQIYLSITGTPSTTGDITFDNFMVRDASITDSTYQPYAKTNVELTADVEEIKNGLELSGYFTGNIDTINSQYGYMYSVDKSKASGTYPTGSGSVFLLLGFSSVNSSDNVVYGVQIALSFSTSTIHIRHFDFTAGGGTWGAWSQIS